MVLVRIVLTILGLLGLGIFGKQVGLLTSYRAEFLNKLAFYVALPALVFHSVLSAPSLGEIFSLDLIIGFLLVVFIISGVAFLVLRDVEDNARRSVSIVQSYHGNLGYIGLPVVSMALGAKAGGEASMILGLCSPFQITLTMSILATLNAAGTDVRQSLKRIFLNPVLIALVLGVLFSYFSLPVHPVPRRVFSLLSRLALPIALLGAGASLDLEKPTGELSLIGRVLGSKLILMPIIGLGVFTILGVNGLSLKTGLLMLAMPTAVSTYIYSREFGGDEKLASLDISIITLVSLLTISILIFLFSI